MASGFVDNSLGRWSSHPANLRKQRKLLLSLGILPVIATIVLCVVIYKDPGTGKSFWGQINLLICSVFFVFGFLFTLCVLYLACFTVGSKKGRLTNKDELVLPPWLLIAFLAFPVVSFLLSLMPDVKFSENLLKAIPFLERLKFEIKADINAVKAILNMLAITPFLCVLTWILCAKEEELKENEKLVRRRWLLNVALVCIGLLVVAFFIPTSYRLAMWIVLLPLSGVALTLWWSWRKKVPADPEKTAEPEKKEGEEEEAEEEGEEKKKLPEQAQYIVDNLPDGISYGDDGEETSIKEFSPRIPENESSFPLIALMDDKRPTEDQADFLTKFSSLFEDTLNNFFENAKPNSEQLLPDIILQGPEGSGRTEALCAAAVYAAAVRGQKVLYIVQDGTYAAALAKKMKTRLHNLLVDSYYTADYLKPNFVESWFSPAKDGKNEEPAKDGKKEDAVRELPPNILFATPEQVEESFFNNGNVNSEDNRETLRNILLSYSTILVDDFLEMPIALQSHLAFILDKFRLLQASEYVVGQFVIATGPLQDPFGIDSLAERLFGVARFNPTKNALALRPRQCDPYWCGTLWIDPDKFGGEQGLEQAARKLLDICTAKNYNTLFYSKGISRKEAEELESAYEKKGTVSVSAHLYQLNVEKMPFDTILYLSLTSGNAAAALRLSLPDDKAGTPVFFRIALVNEAEKKVMDQFALLPNETAISLRAYHLRSVLPLLPRLTPIPASVWSQFGISLTHPFCQDANISKGPQGLAVEWHYDYYTEADRYGDNVIWPYLVLAADTKISNVGQSTNFNILPSTKDSIWRDKQPSGLTGDALYFVAGPKDNEGVSSQLAVWRDAKGNSIGTTDLAHSDQLTLITPDNHFAVDQIQVFDKHDQDASHYAMSIRVQPRRGLSYDIPIRRFSWHLPDGGFQLPDVMNFQDFASFSISFRDIRSKESSFTNRVTAEIDGLMNPLGDACFTDASKGKYVYDAFMSCVVFLPEKDCNEVSIRKSISGTWSTEASSGFSSPLTHAFSIALRNRMAGLAFFAMTPVFLIEGRSGSFGRLLLWLQEPYNSGSTVYPLLAKKLLRDKDFKKALLTDVQNLLVLENNEYATLEGLRSQSQLAFSGEDELSTEAWEDEIKRGLYVLNLMLDSKALKQDIAERAEKRKEADQRRAEEQKKRQEEFIDPTRISEEDKKQYEEFASAVTSDLMAFKDVIDVSHFCRDYRWSEDKILEVFNDFLWNSPEIFFVAKSHSYTYASDSAGNLVSFFIKDIRYGIEKEQFDTAKRTLEQEAAKAMDLLKGVTDPIKKALILHDHIVRICDYDEEARDQGDLSPLARTVYSVLVRHRAVCEGYTMAYRYLLNRAGIRSEEVLSDKMNHCWNYLYLNGSWYHVDVTQDDPVYYGRKPKDAGISHEFFLLSDEKIAQKKHHDWNVRGLPPAADTELDDKDWNHY